MQNSAWKLTALAGVVALGFFAVVQTQRGLWTDSPADNGDETAANAGEKKKNELPLLSAGNGNGMMLTQTEPPGNSGNPFAPSGSKGDSTGFGDPPKNEKQTEPKKSSSKSDGTQSSDSPFNGDAFDNPQNKKTPTPAKKQDDAFPAFGDVKTNNAADKKTDDNKASTGVFNLGGGDQKQPDPKLDKKDDQPNASPGPQFGGTTPEKKNDPPKRADTGKSDNTAGSNPFGSPPGNSNSKTGSASDNDQSTSDSKSSNPVTPPAKTDSHPFSTPPSSGGAAKKSESPAKNTGDTSPTPKPTKAGPIAFPASNSTEKTAPPPSPLFGGPGSTTEPKKEANNSTEPKQTSEPPKTLNKQTEANSLQLLPTKEPKLNTPPKTKSPTRLGSYQVMPRQASRPQLSIAKKAPSNAVLGKSFVYDIIIKNTGSSAAHQVVVEDPIPSGVRLEGTDPQAVLSKKKLMWKLGSVAPGKTVRISVKVTPVRAGQIGSIATVNFVSEVAARTTIKAPKLALDFTGPNTGRLGQTVTFKFTVTNNGSTAAKNVWIRDIIPNGLQHPGGDDLEYEVGTLAPGKSETVTLNMKVVKAGRLTNRAIVTASGGIRMESKVALNVTAPKLIITRAGPTKRYVGLKALYQNMVTNNSGATVDGAILTESVPQGMDFVQASDGGKYDASKRTVTWLVGKLGPKQSRTFKLVLLPKQTGVQNSVVQASASDGGIVKTASATKVEGYASLGVDVPAIERPVTVGEQVSFRVVGRNRGTLASKNVQLKVVLPAQLSLVNIRGRGKYTQQGQTIIFEPVGSLGVNEKLAFDLNLKAVKEGDLRVKVQIQSDEMSKPLLREESVRVLPN